MMKFTMINRFSKKTELEFEIEPDRADIDFTHRMNAIMQRDGPTSTQTW